MQGVCVALDRCRTPDDQEEVEQIVVKIFEKMPEDFVKQEHHKTMRANGLCRVHCIRRLTEEKLQQLGVSMGDSMLILEVLHAEETPEVAGAAAEGGAPRHVEKRPGMRPFPKCGPTKYPDLEGWEPYKTGLRLCVHAELTATGQQAIVGVAQGNAVPTGWARGCPDDVVLFTALVNGTGAMPDDMMQLLPKLLRDTNAGLEVFQHINQRVCAISEAATAVQEEEFKEQKAVLEHKKHLLASVHAAWKQLRDQLDAKQAPQSAAQQRRSITRMVSKLPEVMSRMEASVAAHKVMHPGTELPVATMELVVEEFASKYSSVSAVEGAYSLQMMEAFDATPEYPGPRDQQHQQQHQQGDRKGIPCKFWKAGTCWRKSKCPWRHDGKPGPPPAEAAPPAYSAAVIQREMNKWLAEKVAGVSALLGVCSQVAEGMIVAALQELQVNNHRASVCLGQHPGVALVVVADIGATVRVIGGADTPLIRVFHNSPTTHHNPPQLTITRHNSPQVPEVQVVAPQLTTIHLASFQLYHNLRQLATPHLPSFCLYNNLPQITTTYHNLSQLLASKTHHNSPQLTTVCAGHDSKCEKTILIPTHLHLA